MGSGLWARARSRAGAPEQVQPLGRTLLLFNLSRAGIFLVSAVLTFLITGLNGLPLLFIALIVSLPLSFYLQRRQRDALGRALQARAARRTEATAALRARLDEADPK